jgi:hypothetical protein
MGNSLKTEEARTEAVRRLWDGYAHIFQKRGRDIDKLLRDWTQRQRDKLISPGAREDFDELAGDECVPQVLAVLLVLLTLSPKLEEFWERINGSPVERLKVRRVLVKAADALEQLFSFTISLEDNDLRTIFSEIGRLTPSRLSSELREYASILDLLNSFPREVETRSFKDFLRFLLAAYVKAATGRFRDRNVSGLLAEVLGQWNYNEVAHRMWRHRNFNRMKKHYAQISDLLLRSGQVITSRA